LVLADAILAVALGPECASCRRPLDRPTLGALCATCWSGLRAFVPPLCERCGSPMPSDLSVRDPCPPASQASAARVAHACCPVCLGVESAVDVARAIGPHDGVLRDAVHALKYHRLVSVVAPLAARMREAGEDLLRGADAAVPVPLHPAREWQRGFNQAELLARRLGLPTARVLCRVRATPPQTGLGAHARRRNLHGAFALAPFPRARGVAGWLNVAGWRRARRTAAWVAGRVLVLVDDVSTTGATLEACAATLKEAGAREVRSVTAARAVRGPR
jgi:predicted amidophosphoribosyltransferase